MVKLFSKKVYKPYMTKDKYAFIFESHSRTCRITYDRHKIYKKLIDQILGELYPGRIDIDGLFYVTAQEFDTEGSYTSIINKAIGNITVFISMVNNYNINSFEELIEFIKNNKLDLFKQGGIYFDNILQILKISERKGKRNEIKAIQHIESYLISKNYEFTIKQTPALSKLDVINGIDLIIYVNNREYYAQIKPLKSYVRRDDTYEIISSGKIKKYDDIHFYIFVNDDKCLLFTNPNLEVINGIIYVPKENLKA
jgi:hypothetical protein